MQEPPERFPTSDGCAILVALAAVGVAALLTFWWLVQPGGLLHNSFAPR